MTALDNLSRVRADLDGLSPYQLRRELNGIIEQIEQRQQDAARIRDERDQLRLEFYCRERKVERLIAAGHSLAVELTDSVPMSDVDPQIARATTGWYEAVADLQAEEPPPVARDPIPDTGGKIKW